MSDRFYTPDPLGPGEYVLSGPEAHHLAAVRRFGPGDRVVLFNGDGRDYPAEVVLADRKRSVLTVLDAVPAGRLGRQVRHGPRGRRDFVQVRSMPRRKMSANGLATSRAETRPPACSHRYV